MEISCGPILCKPLLNSLIFFYNTIALQDLGLAIIILTLSIRIVLFPVFHRSVKHQMLTQRLQPEVKKIQSKHKDNKQRQGEEILALYRKHGTNPLAGLGLILVQIPILFSLFHIFRNIVHPDIFGFLYSFVQEPEILNKTLLSLINLGEASIVMVAIAAAAQFVQGKLSLTRGKGGGSQAEKIARNMVYVGPVITLVIFVNLPAAITLYWLTSSLFSIGQQLVINKNLRKDELEGIRAQNNRADGVSRVER